MKKITYLLALISPIVLLAGCDKASAKKSTFTELKDNETLIIGENARFKNNVTVDETVINHSYTAYSSFSLNRSSYQNYPTDVRVGSYWYRWEGMSTQDTVELGTMTQTVETSYSYMSYSKDDYIVLKTTVKTIVDYHFEGGIKTFPRTVDYDLNGYYASLEALQNESLELYNALDLSTSVKQYVPAKDKTTITSSRQSYNTYWSVEKSN